jgi:hypothetical protein
VVGADPEERLSRIAEAGMGVCACLLRRHLHHEAEPQRPYRALIERFRSVYVRNRQADMVEQVQAARSAIAPDPRANLRATANDNGPGTEAGPIVVRLD